MGKLSTTLLVLWLALQGSFADEPYKSPYSVKFTFTEKELVGDLMGARGHSANQSSIGFGDWYSPETKKRFGSWGPPAQRFPPPTDPKEQTGEWMRQRIIATALRFQGYHYQHHHIPDWEPPADWPYSPSPLGHQSKGVDCSNFTSFVYNVALGVKPSGDIHEQSRMVEVAGPGPNQRREVLRIDAPPDHADFSKLLRTGDLLFIKGKTDGDITHVVIWVGAVGQARNEVPLILDSTGEGRKDENGTAIPDGVQLRPFIVGSWYYRCASHALRLITEK